MASAAEQDSSDMITGINVTPLVDITLVLLIIFMVTAKLVLSPAVPLELPPASQSQQVQAVFSVILPASGGTLVNGEPVDDDALRRFAENAARGDKEARAVINADGAVPHRRVIHALDVLKRAGISRIAFGARPTEEPVPAP